MNEEELRIKELEDLKVLRAKKFMSEYPHNRYSTQFLPEEPMKASEIRVLEIRRRLAERQQRREEVSTLASIARKKREAERQAKRDALATIKLRKKQKRREKFLERIKQAHDLIKGRTLAQVGVLMGGITRQRVEQLLKAGESMGLPRWERKIGNGKPRPVRTVTCSCGKVFQTRNRRTKYCSHTCFSLYGRKYFTPEEVKLGAAKRNRERYHNNPEARNRMKESTKRWRDKLKKDPVRWAAFRKREDAYQKEWLARKKKQK